MPRRPLTLIVFGASSAAAYAGLASAPDLVRRIMDGLEQLEVLGARIQGTTSGWNGGPIILPKIAPETADDGKKDGAQKAGNPQPSPQK